MKLSSSLVNYVLDLTVGKPYIIAIENPDLLRKTIEALMYGRSNDITEVVLSDDNDSLSISKNLELITDIFSLELNQKSFLTKIFNELAVMGVDSKLFDYTMELRQSINKYIFLLTQESEIGLNHNTDFSLQKIFSLVGISVDESGSRLQCLEDYIILCNRLLGKRVFVIYNTFAVFSEDDILMLCRDLSYKEVFLVFLEPAERNGLDNSKQIVIDKDMCIVKWIK